MKGSNDDEKDGRYFPNDTEMPILIHHLQIYFSHPERSIQRSQVVQTVAGILSPTNKHWDHRTIRLWFNNNKRNFFKPGQNQNFQENEYTENETSNPFLSDVPQPKVFVPQRSLSVVQMPPKESEPIENMRRALTPTININMQPKPGSFAMQLMQEKEVMITNMNNLQIQFDAELRTSEKINAIYEQKWSQINPIQPCQSSITDPASLPTMPQAYYQLMQQKFMNNIQSYPPVLKNYQYDLIEASTFSNNGNPIVAFYDGSSLNNKIHFNDLVLDTPFISHISSMLYDDVGKSIWFHSGNTLSAIGCDSNFNQQLCTGPHHSFKSAMTFWENNLVLSLNSTILTSKREIIYSQPSENLRDNFGVCLTLIIPNIDSLATVNNNLVVASSEYHTAHIIAQNGACINRCIGHTAGITALHGYDANTFITGSADQTAKYWDIRVPIAVYNLTRHKGIVTAIFGDGNNKPNIIFTGGTDGFIRIWDIREMKIVSSINLINATPQSIYFDNMTKNLTVINSEKAQDYYYDLGRFTRPCDMMTHMQSFGLNSVVLFQCNI